MSGQAPDYVHQELTSQIIAAAIDVHRELGPGLLESTYESCLEAEIVERGLAVRRQLSLPVLYKGRMIECGYRIDLLVNDAVIVEVKSVEKLAPVHEAQLLTYLRMSGHPVGLLINFNVPMLRDGLKRMALTRR